jgi:hypothetical protein
MRCLFYLFTNWFTCLPTGLADARDQSLIGELAKTNAADAELAINGARAAAHLAAAPMPGGELGGLLGFRHFGFTGHDYFSAGVDLFLVVGSKQ